MLPFIPFVDTFGFRVYTGDKRHKRQLKMAGPADLSADGNDDICILQ